MAMRLRYSPEVIRAREAQTPLVALESTIISHGMPYPQNVQCAREVEDIIRKTGATPATIGIIKGQIHVGMTDEQLNMFGQTACEKVSRRDLAGIVGRGLDGATTVAATMLIAHMAGIRVFVTGGIGGVHRGAEETWDVSADLTELGRTPVAVVCAGAKSILDLDKTLEYLETQGVAVIGLRTRTFPAFFTPSSGLPVPTSCESEEEVAQIIDAHVSLGLASGLVIGNPIPAQLAAETATIEEATAKAVAEAAAQKVSGREATPFLLRRINELTQGESLRANTELIKHNAKAGARIAVSLRTQASGGGGSSSSTSPGSQSRGVTGSLAAQLRGPQVVKPKLAVIGGAVLDFTAKPYEKRRFGEFGTVKTSVPGTMTTSMGGVGRSIAESIHRLMKGREAVSSWIFETVIGDDGVGTQIEQSCSQLPALLHRLPGRSTATYTAMLDGLGELVTAIADMAVFDSWPPLSEMTLASSLLVMDTNVPEHVLDQACKAGKEVWIEPVSVAKAKKITGCLSRTALVTPNVDELRSMVEALGGKWHEVDTSSAEALARTLPHAAEPVLLTGVRHVLVTCGPLGAVLCSLQSSSQELSQPPSSDREVFAFADPAFTVERRRWNRPGLPAGCRFIHYSVPPLTDVQSVTGAGDSLIAGMAWATASEGVAIEDAVPYGLASARLCLATLESVSPLLSPERIAPRRVTSKL